MSELRYSLGITDTDTTLPSFDFIYAVLIMDSVEMVGDVEYCGSTFSWYWFYLHRICPWCCHVFSFSNIRKSRMSLLSFLVIILVYWGLKYSLMCNCNNCICTEYLPFNLNLFNPFRYDYWVIAWCTTVTNMCIKYHGFHWHMPYHFWINGIIIHGWVTSLLQIYSLLLVTAYIPRIPLHFNYMVCSKNNPYFLGIQPLLK